MGLPSRPAGGLGLRTILPGCIDSLILPGYMSGMTDIPAAPVSALRCTAFVGPQRLASGPYAEVAVAVKQRVRAEPDAAILIFDDASGREVDFDLRGSDADIADRVARQFAAPAEAARPAGRPKLGVGSREVTLLPRHWEWLAAQQGGASVTLRKLIEDARRKTAAKDEARERQESVHRFLSAIAGDKPHYEDALRALYAHDGARFHTLIADWPTDVRRHVERLASELFDDTAETKSA